MNIFVAGDIVGAPGRRAFTRMVETLKAEGRADVVVANAENAAGGKGITQGVAEGLLEAGADVLTMVDHTWDQKESVPFFDIERRLIRPANFAPGCPGRGVATVDTAWGRVSVINLVGRVFMPPNDCPFRTADALLAKEPGLGKVILVDLHAEATSEKVAMGRYLDGRVSAVVGTHTHVQTADEQVLPGGTAYLTDLGMTGPKDSVIGRDAPSILGAFLTGMPARFVLAEKEVTVEGAVIEVDEKTGRARGITRVRERME